MRTHFALLLLLSLSACASGAGPGCRLEKVAELPVDFTHNVPVVAVQINGKPARMIIDTGSDGTVLTQQAAGRLGIVAGSGTRTLGGAGGTAKVGIGRADSVTIGGAVQQGTRIAIADMPNLGVDGLLGIDTLVDYELDLDVPQRRAGFYRARACVDALPDFPGRIIRLPTQQQARSGHIFVSLQVDGTPLRGMLDSGASTSTLSLQAAEDTGLSARRLAQLPRGRGLALNKEGLAFSEGIFDAMQVGEDRLAHPRMTVADIPPFAGDLLVGEDYIGTRRIWFSFRLGRVFVEGPGG